MDPNIFDILEFLASKGIGTTTDIGAHLNKIRSTGDRLQKPGDVMRFFDSLETITSYNSHTPYRDEPNLGFIG